MLLAIDLALHDRELGFHSRKLALEVSKLHCRGRSRRRPSRLSACAGLGYSLIDLGKLFSSLDEFRVFVGELGRVILDLSFEIGFAFEKRAVRIIGSGIIGRRRRGPDDLLLLRDQPPLIGDLRIEGELLILKCFERRLRCAAKLRDRAWPRGSQSRP